MKQIDLKDLIIGLMTLILLSMSLGQYGKLHDFAKRQAVAALKPWPAHRFFPQSYVEKSFHNPTGRWDCSLEHELLYLQAPFRGLKKTLRILKFSEGQSIVGEINRGRKFLGAIKHADIGLYAPLPWKRSKGR